MTLVVLTVGLLFAFLLASNASIQLNMVAQSMEHQSARNLADSVTAAAIAKLFNNATYGDKSAIEISATQPHSQGKSYLRFKAAASDPANGYYVPASINNLAIDDPSAVPMPGWKRTVPVGCADLIAESTTGSAHVLTEQILNHCGLFYSLASGGPVSLSAVDIFAVPSPTSVTRDSSGKLVIDQNKQQPSDLVANDGSNANPAALLQNQTNVSGDVEALGPVVIHASTVKGEVDNRTSPVTLPTLKYADMSSPFVPYSTQIADTFTSDTTFDSIVQAPSGLTIDGTLQLQDAVLLVSGDLHVTKGIEGHGAVLVSGSVYIGGSANIVADTQMALLADGDIHINGVNKSESALTGLVYAGGTIVAQHISLFGCAIAAGNGQATIKNANLVAMPIDFTLTVTAGQYPLGNVGTFYTVQSQATMGGHGAYTFQLMPSTLSAGFQGDPYQRFYDTATHKWRQPTVNDLVFSTTDTSLSTSQVTQIVKSTPITNDAASPPPQASLGFNTPPTASITTTAIQNAIDKLYAWLLTLPLNEKKMTVPQTLSIDLNQFVGLEDTTQIIFCREQAAFIP